MRMLGQRPSPWTEPRNLLLTLLERKTQQKRSLKRGGYMPDPNHPQEGSSQLQNTKHIIPPRASSPRPRRMPCRSCRKETFSSPTTLLLSLSIAHLTGQAQNQPNMLLNQRSTETRFSSTITTQRSNTNS